MKNMVLKLMAIALFPMQVMAACTQDPTCAELGFLYTQSDCGDYNKIKCPFDDAYFCSHCNNGRGYYDECPTGESCTWVKTVTGNCFKVEHLTCAANECGNRANNPTVCKTLNDCEGYYYNYTDSTGTHSNLPPNATLEGIAALPRQMCTLQTATSDGVCLEQQTAYSFFKCEDSFCRDNNQCSQVSAADECSDKPWKLGTPDLGESDLPTRDYQTIIQQLKNAVNFTGDACTMKSAGYNTQCVTTDYYEDYTCAEGYCKNGVVPNATCGMTATTCVGLGYRKPPYNGKGKGNSVLCYGLPKVQLDDDFVLNVAPVGGEYELENDDGSCGSTSALYYTDFECDFRYTKDEDNWLCKSKSTGSGGGSTSGCGSYYDDEDDCKDAKSSSQKCCEFTYNGNTCYQIVALTAQCLKQSDNGGIEVETCPVGTWTSYNSCNSANEGMGIGKCCPMSGYTSCYEWQSGKIACEASNTAL